MFLNNPLCCDLGDQVVDQWYKEIEKHDFVKNDYNPGIG